MRNLEQHECQNMKSDQNLYLWLLACFILAFMGLVGSRYALAQTAGQSHPRSPTIQSVDLNKPTFKVIHDRAAQHVTSQHLQECYKKAAVVPRTIGTAAFKFTAPLRPESRLTCFFVGHSSNLGLVLPPVAVYAAPAEYVSGYRLFPAAGPELFWCRFKYSENTIKLDAFGVGVTGSRNQLYACGLS
jgi:hypothetical protein